MSVKTGLLEPEDFDTVRQLASEAPIRLLTDAQAAAVANVIDELASGECRTVCPSTLRQAA